jgi:hypothetical protein
MEERLQEALSFANYKQTLNNQLHKLRLKTEGMFMIAESGGKFTVSQELICFLDYTVRSGLSEVVLLDDNKSPVRIADTTLFLKKVSDRYFEVTNDYFREAQSIKKSRAVKSILDIKVE